jgi:hypothetical protein
MSPSLPNYPLLELDTFAQEWAEYTRTEKRDIDTPKQLLAWWKSHRESAFRDRVLFLITSPVSSAAVERFFSLCGQLADDQWALSENARRLQFLLQFNGDLESRL